jgi:hydroxyethylthiazole kinase
VRGPLEERAAALLVRLRERRPLVHHFPNAVTAGAVADLTLALGAAPVMARAAEEVEEAVEQAQALVLNAGTLTPDGAAAMTLAGRRANRRGIPVVLDPVGAGSTSFRTARITQLLEDVRCACVRGNAGEVAALAGRAHTVVGVDARGAIEDLPALAAGLAQRTGATVAATGAEDLITDGRRTVRLRNGHPLLARITGAGCMASAAVGAAAAVERDPLAAAAAGLLWVEIAAELAAERAAGPGTFRPALLDALAALDPGTITARARLVEA